MRGKDALLLAGSNAEAADLARMARETMVEWGVLDARDEVTLSDENAAGTGDLVRARLNADIDAAGQSLANRDVLRITGWFARGAANEAAVVERQLDDGSWSDPFHVPDAVPQGQCRTGLRRQRASLRQGRTVDVGHLVVSESLTRESLYVGMTRGWEENWAHVVTGPVPVPGPDKTELVPPEAVLAAAMKREDAELSATETIREAQAWATNSRHLFELWRALTRKVAFPCLRRRARAAAGRG